VYRVTRDGCREGREERKFAEEETSLKGALKYRGGSLSERGRLSHQKVSKSSPSSGEMFGEKVDRKTFNLERKRPKFAGRKGGESTLFPQGKKILLYDVCMGAEHKAAERRLSGGKR